MMDIQEVTRAYLAQDSAAGTPDPEPCGLELLGSGYFSDVYTWGDAKAMQGILSNGALCDDGNPEQIKYVRDTAFAVADAMLAQREK